MTFPAPLMCIGLSSIFGLGSAVSECPSFLKARRRMDGSSSQAREHPASTAILPQALKVNEGAQVISLGAQENVSDVSVKYTSFYLP